MSLLRSTYRRVRRAVNVALGRDIRFGVQVRRPMVRHGSADACWWVSPADLQPGALVYCVGIGTDITFDLSVIQAYGVTVHAFDPTPESIRFVEQQSLPPEYSWHPVGLASYDGRATFHPPHNPNHVSHSMIESMAGGQPAITVEVRRLATLMQDLGHHRVAVLKMDIEGAEYDVIDDILASRLDIDQLLIEFHHRFTGIGIERTRQAVRKLNDAGYRIFFAAENGEEYSFIRGD
jgi:FkbM family methyltransferase